MLHTRHPISDLRIVFSTFRRCMSFYTARVRLGHSATSRFAGKRTRLKRFTSTRPNKRDRSSLCGRSLARVPRDPESEPLAASRRSPIPATMSIAEEARGRRGPRRGRSSALARSIDLDQPKKEGPGGINFRARPTRSGARCQSRFSSRRIRTVPRRLVPRDDPR
jgi:hypothetical protein